MFSLPQAAAVAQAAATHILPFREPVREIGGDLNKFVGNVSVCLMVGKIDLTQLRTSTIS